MKLKEYLKPDELLSAEAFGISEKRADELNRIMKKMESDHMIWIRDIGMGILNEGRLDEANTGLIEFGHTFASEVHYTARVFGDLELNDERELLYVFYASCRIMDGVIKNMPEEIVATMHRSIALYSKSLFSNYDSK